MREKKWMAILVVTLWRSIALGSIGDAPPSQFYTVPGVLHTSYLATVFPCTNSNPTGTAAVLVTVEVFNASGPLESTAGWTLESGESVLFATGTVASLGPDVNLAVAAPLVGVARINTSKKVLCAAYVMSPGSVPGYMNALPVLLKNKQKGQ